jgi:hypothetical protein
MFGNSRSVAYDDPEDRMLLPEDQNKSKCFSKGGWASVRPSGVEQRIAIPGT